MVFFDQKKSLFACEMKMLPDQSDNYLIEASRLTISMQEQCFL